MFTKLKQIFLNKYLKSIIRNILQFSFGAVTGALTIIATKQGVAPEAIGQLVKELNDLKEPLEVVIVPLMSSLAVLASSLITQKKINK